MKRSNIFWGLVIILIGISFLLRTLGIIQIDVWSLIWPAGLILAGLWFLFGRPEDKPSDKGAQPGVPSGDGQKAFTPQSGSNHLSIPIEDSREARITFRHGAGNLSIESTPLDTTLLEGDFNTTVESEINRNGTQAILDLKLKETDFIPFPNSNGANWSVGLNRTIPLDITIKTGAADSNLNFRDLRLNRFKLETGASNTAIVMPAAAGYTQAELSAGAASISITVPEGVTAHIEVSNHLSGLKIDTERFHNIGNFYESPNYLVSENRVDIRISSGLANIEIH